LNLADSIDGRTNALTVSDVAELLKVSERQVYKLAAENLIPSFKVGGSVRFDPATIAAWLRQKNRTLIGSPCRHLARNAQNFLRFTGADRDPVVV
jgi:excisionase family DNA binding protein